MPVQCQQCQTLLSYQDSRCPKCGTPKRSWARKLPASSTVVGLRVTAALVLVAAVILWASTINSEPGAAGIGPRFVAFTVSTAPYLIVAAILWAASEIIDTIQNMRDE